MRAVSDMGGPRSGVRLYMYIRQCMYVHVLVSTHLSYIHDMATPTRTPRGSGELLRERLLDAAIEIVAEQGGRAGSTSSVTIRAVTKRAGVSPTAFYLHFESRDALLEAVIERGFTAFRAEMRAAVAAGEDAPSRLLGAGLAYLRFAEEQPALYAIIFGPHEHPSPDDHEAGEMSGPGAGAFDDLLALVAGYLGDRTPDEDGLRDLALGIWSGLHGYATLCHATQKQDWPDGERFATMLARAWLGPYSG